MKVEELYFVENLYEMSNFRSDVTGLPNGVELWLRTEPKVLPHVKYRIKIKHIQKGSAIFSIWGEDIVQLSGNWKVSGIYLSKLKKLVSLTKNDLINHIDGKEDSFALGQALFSVKNQILLE